MIYKHFTRHALATLLLLAAAFGAIAQTPAVTGTITTQNLVPTGAATPGSCVAIEVNNQGVATVQVSDTYTGALSAQVTINETTWATLAPTPFIPATALGTPTATIASGATGIWEVAGIAGKQQLRICALSAVTGGASVTLNTSPATPASSATLTGDFVGGDASASNQVTGNASLASIDSKTPALVSGRMPVDGSGVTQPVSGTVAATQSGNWSMRTQDGTGNALTSASRGSERALSVQLVDASGAQITSFGGAGGTASTVGSAVPSTATAAGASDGTNMQMPRVYDSDTGGGTQYTLGVNLRLAGSGGSVEAGTSSNPLRVDPTGTTTQPVSASSLPLPSGAATAANQSTLITSAGNIDTDLGAAADSACGTDTGTCSLIALIKRLITQLVASNAQLPTALGTGTDSASLGVAFSTEGKAQLGSLTETAPASDTASSGLNGRGQRVAQNITAMSAKLPATLGVKPPATSLATVLASQSTASVPIGISTATTTQLVALASGQVIHVTSWDVVAGGTGTFRLVYGTGSNCGTGTTNLTGAYSLIANAGLTKGSGVAPVLLVPAGNALCAVTSAAVAMDGSLSYAQFTP